VATPIGNLEDITLRGLRVLREADLIAAESVQHSKKLCRHYDIRTPVTAYNQHNRRRREPDLIRQLRAGKNVALVSSAGTPGISDPGVPLIRRALEEEIPVRSVPGPSAAVSALTVSGLRTDRFVFQGFLPNKAGRRRSELRSLKDETRTLVFYEAPHRIRDMLDDLLHELGDRDLVLVREMTKIHEEIRRGTAASLLRDLSEGEAVRGEITLVVAGKEEVRGGEAELDRDLMITVETRIREGKESLKDVAGDVAREQGLPYRQVYRICLAVKKGMQRKENPEQGIS
jgi:16S rRNA (cytidine1402-2'-O)-methyltransferase